MNAVKLIAFTEILGSRSDSCIIHLCEILAEKTELKIHFTWNVFHSVEFWMIKFNVNLIGITGFCLLPVFQVNAHM